MTDLSLVLPAFPTQTYARLIPSLEKNLVTTSDLLTLDAVEIAKRAQLPILDVKRLCNDVLRSLQATLGVGEEAEGSENVNRKGALQRTGKEVVASWSTISTLDRRLDQVLEGGIATGYITEITGER